MSIGTGPWGVITHTHIAPYCPIPPYGTKPQGLSGVTAWGAASDCRLELLSLAKFYLVTARSSGSPEAPSDTADSLLSEGSTAASGFFFSSIFFAEIEVMG